MIDIENDINEKIETLIAAQYPNALLTNEEFNNVPSTFPAISIHEVDNYVDVTTQDSSSNENHDIVMYEVEVYTSGTDSKKQDAKTIMKVIDAELIKLGFTRTMKNPIPMQDTTKYRLLCRYEAKVGKDKTIYRR